MKYRITIISSKKKLEKIIKKIFSYYNIKFDLYKTQLKLSQLLLKVNFEYSKKFLIFFYYQLYILINI